MNSFLKLKKNTNSTGYKAQNVILFKLSLILTTGVLLILNKNFLFMMYNVLSIEDILILLYAFLIILIWHKIRRIIFKNELIIFKKKKNSKITFIDFLAGILLFVLGGVSLIGTVNAEFEIVNGVEVITHTHNKSISFNQSVLVKQIPYVSQNSDGSVQILLDNETQDLKTLEVLL